MSQKYASDSGGSFVFISSIMGLLGQAGKIGYCSSKAALLAGTKAMALELAPKKIRVNCLLPGVVDTEMTHRLFSALPEESKKAVSQMHPLGFGKADDVALACVFLLSDAASWITGAGRFAREMGSWLDLIQIQSRIWNIEGFLYHPRANENPLGGYPTKLNIVGDCKEYEFRNDDLCVLGFMDPEQKREAYSFLTKRVKFFTYIAPSVVLGKFVDIEEGSIICPNSIITTNIKIGRCVTINCGTQIGHDPTIENFSSIMTNVDIGGDCLIGESVFIGSGATIIPKRKIGHKAKIGAGSVVISNIKNGLSVFGNPAKKISV